MGASKAMRIFHHNLTHKFSVQHAKFKKDLWQNPNQLSQEMVQCMEDIFIHLADPVMVSSKFSPLSQENMVDRARHRQFQAAVLRQLYPPDDSENEVEKEQIVDVPEILGNLQSEDNINANLSDSPSDSAESCSQHLTRAQRKRIRKKKLKEAASNTKKFIGPLLPAKPLVEDFSTEDLKCPDAEPSGVQSQERSGISDVGERKVDYSKEIGPSTGQRKLKQRRHAKRLNQGTERSIQREQHGKVFMAETCGDGVVLKHV